MIVYLLVRRLLGLAVLVFRRDLAKDAELLVVRHENAVLRRSGDPGRAVFRRCHSRGAAACGRLVCRTWGFHRMCGFT
jgi:hypothetical protein